MTDGPRPESTLESTSVLIRGGRIEAVAPDPELASTAADIDIDAAGRWVMPGLADMHCHLTHAEQANVFLAHGITTVRDMWGSAQSLAWREAAASGRRLGPHIVAASPLIDGPLPDGSPRYPGVIPVGDPGAAAQAARDHIADGFDQLKVYSGLSLDALRAVGAVASTAGVRVAGHCPEEATYAQAIGAGMTGFEHCVEVYNGCLRPDAAGSTSPPPGLAAAVAAIAARFDPGLLAQTADLMREKEGAICPTLWIQGRIADSREDRVVDPALRHVPSEAVALWSRNHLGYGTAPEDRRRLRDLVHRAQEQRAAAMVLLHRAGVPLLVGTDSSSLWTVAGFAMARELRALIAAGLAPADVLRAATPAAADFCHGSRVWGRVSPGLRADLVLLDQDPVADVTAATRPSAVVIAGRVLDRAALDELIRAHATVIQEVGSRPDDDLGPMGRPAWFARGL